MHKEEKLFFIVGDGNVTIVIYLFKVNDHCCLEVSVWPWLSRIVRPRIPYVHESSSEAVMGKTH